MFSRLLQSHAIRAFLISAAVWLTAFGLLKERLWRAPRSGFFEDAKVYDLGYSALRQEEARAWTSAQNSGVNHRLQFAAATAPICAALVTYDRPQRQYLNETIGSMLMDLTADERQAINVRLVFAHTDPAVHPDWNRTWLQVLDSWTGYNATEQDLETVRKAEEERNFYFKGVFDYTYALEECISQTSSPFIAIFEDDVIFAEAWLPKTVSALRELKFNDRTWLYLRLFYTETSLGWETELDFWYRNMPAAFLCTMTVVLLLLLCLRWSLPRLGLSLTIIAVLVLVTTPAFVQLIFMVGKYNLAPLRGVERMDRYGCCTQALVFPRDQAVALLHFLRTRTGQTDALIEEYANKQGLERYALAPQVVQHVGLVSSRDNDEINTRSTWAFWFEAQRAEVLRKEHLEMAATMEWRSLLADNE